MLTLTTSSTIYMDGTAVYDVRRADRPGILARLRLTADEAVALVDAFEEDRD